MTIRAQSFSVIFLAITFLALLMSLSQAISLKQSNSTEQETAPVEEIKPTGTVLFKFGAFCAKKSRQCASYCKNTKGESMDEDTLDSFFCYTSKDVAGGNMSCKSDDDCMDDNFRAIGRHCSKAQECKGVRMNRM